MDLDEGYGMGHVADSPTGTENIQDCKDECDMSTECIGFQTAKGDNNRCSHWRKAGTGNAKNSKEPFDLPKDFKVVTRQQPRFDEIVQRAIKPYGWSAWCVVVGTGPSTFASYWTENMSSPGSVYVENCNRATIVGFEPTISWRARRPRAPDRPRRALSVSQSRNGLVHGHVGGGTVAEHNLRATEAQGARKGLKRALYCHTGGMPFESATWRPPRPA